MKLKNSSWWPDAFLRRMLRWTCRELGYPSRMIVEATFRKRPRRAYSGYAWPSRRIVVGVGSAHHYPLKPDMRPGLDGLAIADQIEALVAVTAHEMAHLCQFRDKRIARLREDRKCERDARWHERIVLEAFRKDREALLADWNDTNTSPQAGDERMTARKNRRPTIATGHIKKIAEHAATMSLTPTLPAATGSCIAGGDHEWKEDHNGRFCDKCLEPFEPTPRKKAKAKAATLERPADAQQRPAPSKKLSAIDAAATVLAAANKPMGTKQMIEAMAAAGLWTSPGGKTPHATLYSAILREITVRGDNARFVKADRGTFATRAAN